MLVTLFPMMTEFKLLQFQKAPLPMLVTPFPMVTEVKSLHPSKA